MKQNVPPHCLPLDEGACTEGNDGQTQNYSSPEKVTSVDFFIDRTFCNLVVAGDHHPPPQIALVLIAERG